MKYVMLAAAVIAAIRMIGFGVFCIKEGNTVGGISVFFLTGASFLAALGV